MSTWELGALTKISDESSIIVQHCKTCTSWIGKSQTTAVSDFWAGHLDTGIHIYPVYSMESRCLARRGWRRHTAECGSLERHDLQGQDRAFTTSTDPSQAAVTTCFWNCLQNRRQSGAQTAMCLINLNPRPQQRALQHTPSFFEV